MLRSAHSINSIRELGCNIGLNLIALKKIKKLIKLTGYEINENAALQASKHNVAKIYQASILDKIKEPPVDLTFTCGVLIHINPNYLDDVYSNLVNGSNRYVLVAEYYNPVPVKVKYRDKDEKLFKRDFAGELIDKFDLKLLDYGFIYHRDNYLPQDDITWFLLEK